MFWFKKKTEITKGNLCLLCLVVQLFVELNELIVEKDHEMRWKERARWIKFEEDVEEETDRWGKPHVASLSFRSLLELRRTITHGKRPSTRLSAHPQVFTKRSSSSRAHDVMLLRCRPPGPGAELSAWHRTSGGGDDDHF